MKWSKHPGLIATLVSLLVLEILLSEPLRAQENSTANIAKQPLQAARRAVLKHRRRIIMNNDGCDCLYFPKDQEVTAEAFLDQRTTALAGTHVDTIAYCSISSGFSFFTHDTQVGTLLSRQGADFGILPNMCNIAPQLMRQETDPLRLVTAFAHEHDMEVFWSMRMNDTHDSAHSPNKPYFLFPPLKEEHPEWLVGNCTQRTPYGRWSSVDYARPEIRDLAFQYIEEVCRNYDVDGIELDFFRHLCYFKETAAGGKASSQQRTMMTSLMRRVRQMTEDVATHRDRPLLIAIRVPDSVGYCQDMGFDLRQWLQEGLIDILVTTGYFRLNPWDYSVKLGHQYQVAVYPCLSDSRVIGESRFRRSSLEGYRGRAMNAWAAKADGIHLFNYFNPTTALWTECGDEKTLAELNKLYFVTVRDGDPNAFLANGDQYQTVPVLTPTHPMPLEMGQTLTLPIVIGDDFSAADETSTKPNVTLHMECPLVLQAKSLQVRLNGTELVDPTGKEGWIDYQVDTKTVKRGINMVEIDLVNAPVTKAQWNVNYTATTMPSKSWHRDPGSTNTDQELTPEGLRIDDHGTVSGDYLYYRYPWGVRPGNAAVIEARMKAISGGSYIILANGISGERLMIAPGHIQLYHHRNLRYDMDTTGDFHTYRIVIDGENLQVFVDGVLRIEAPTALTARRGYSRNELAFGAANSTDVGAGIWNYVKARTTNATVRDIVMRVRFPK